MQNTRNDDTDGWPDSFEEVAKGWNAIEVPVHFHVLHDSERKRGRVKESRLDDQIKILNRAFASGRITFVGRSREFLDRREWFRLGLGSDEEMAAKSALSKETDCSLNFYVANLRGTGTNGYAQQPWEYRHFPMLDGVVVHYDYLPCGPEPYHRGGLGVHEVGHWLGLHHTFEGYGNGYGDWVPDTPDQIMWTSCNFDTEKRKCAPSSGGEAVRNYMDKVCDCGEAEFTLGQMYRIREVVLPRHKPSLQPAH